MARTRWGIGAVVVALGVALALPGWATLDTWQRRAIFQHESSGRFIDLPAPEVAEVFDLPLADGERVHAWYLPAAAGAVQVAPTVLFLHGARRNLNGSTARIDRLRALGFNVLAIDYRGFGRSSPRLPSEGSAIEDTLAAYAELARRQPDPARRFVYGYSLGGALAIALAEQRDGLAGVMVEASFTSITDLVRGTRWGWVPFLGAVVTQEFDSLDRVARVTEPLLLIHGTADRLIPHTMSDALAAAARRVPPELKQVFKVEGATHRGAPALGGDAFDATVRRFAAQASRHAQRLAPGAADTNVVSVSLR
jgi:alpha-beta hydrolase superfamily lysophospholipase